MARGPGLRKFKQYGWSSIVARGPGPHKVKQYGLPQDRLSAQVDVPLVPLLLSAMVSSGLCQGAPARCRGIGPTRTCSAPQKSRRSVMRPDKTKWDRQPKRCNILWRQQLCPLWCTQGTSRRCLACRSRMPSYWRLGPREQHITTHLEKRGEMGCGVIQVLHIARCQHHTQSPLDTKHPAGTHRQAQNDRSLVPGSHQECHGRDSGSGATATTSPFGARMQAYRVEIRG